jgi:hypothetical protein
MPPVATISSESDTKEKRDDFCTRMSNVGRGLGFAVVALVNCQFTPFALALSVAAPSISIPIAAAITAYRVHNKRVPSATPTEVAKNFAVSTLYLNTITLRGIGDNFINAFKSFRAAIKGNSADVPAPKISDALPRPTRLR